MSNQIQFKSEIFSAYADTLVDRCFKILPLFEEGNEGLFAYVQSLIYELNGLYWTIDALKGNGDYLILLATLESISDDVMFVEDGNHAVLKREVFKCLEIIKRIKTTSESGE